MAVLRVGVYVDAHGLTVVGFLLSRRFPWTDLEEFAVEPLNQYSYFGWVVLHNGRHIPMLMAISAAGWPKPAHSSGQGCSSCWGSSSRISYHGAFEPTNMWAIGLRFGSSTSDPYGTRTLPS
jgi:hypothetical protein